MQFSDAVPHLESARLGTVVAMVAMHDHDRDLAGSDTDGHALIGIADPATSFALTRSDVALVREVAQKANAGGPVEVSFLMGPGAISGSGPAIAQCSWSGTGRILPKTTRRGWSISDR